MDITSINDALRAFNKVEDKRDELRAKYEKKDSLLREARETLERYLIEEMNKMELKSFELPGEGVASIKVKRRFGAADWSIVWDWIIENKMPEILQKRLLDTAIQKYLEDNGALPPGISTEAKMIISVTKRG